MTETDRIDNLLDLHIETKRKVLELFGVEPTWHHFRLIDRRRCWWCIVGDELASQIGDEPFDEATVRRGAYRSYEIDPDAIRELDDRVLVSIEFDFDNAFYILDRSKRLTEEQTKIVQEHL